MEPPTSSWIVLVSVIAVCSCNDGSVENIDFRPAARNDGWDVSTPEEQGIDRGLVEDTYRRAAGIENSRSLLVARHGRLIAEAYFHGGGIDVAQPTASVTKSVVSALVGIALRDGLLASVDQRMVDSFPEVHRDGLDPRKATITLRQMLQMRSGYPWEERSGHLNALFSTSNWIPLIEGFPLTSDPGTQFGYSNLTAHLTGIIVARAVGASLVEYADARLFGPVGETVPYWPRDSQGYCWGSGDVNLTPRSMTKFGQVYLADGVWQGIQVVPSEWVAESREAYSHDTYGQEILTYVRGIDYGYLWWSAVCGGHPVDFAWGHGGQVIFVIRDLDMVVVATAEYLGLQFGDEAWRKEKAILELVGRFVSSL
jgi:CubicO group peptidase (beta-lactamase class C family)